MPFIFHLMIIDMPQIAGIDLIYPKHQLVFSHHMKGNKENIIMQQSGTESNLKINWFLLIIP